MGYEVAFGDEALQCAGHVVVVADVQVVAVDLQGAGAGAHTAFVKTVVVLGALGGVAYERTPGPIGLVGGIALVLAHVNGEGAHGSGLFVQGAGVAGADHDVQLAVELLHLIDTAAAVDILSVDGGQVVETRHVGDHFVGVRIGRGLGCHKQRLALAVRGRLEVAGDQRIAEGADGTGGGEHVALDQGTEAIHVDAVIHLGELVVVGRVDFVDARESVLIGHGGLDLLLGEILVVGVHDHALEVQLAVHLEGAAEGRDHALASVDAGALGHEDLGLAGLHIELEQHAAGALAVGFAKVHVARVHGLDECGGLLGGQAEACHIAVQNGLHAEAAVHGADVDPVAGGCCRIAVGLAAVAVAGGAQAGGIGGDGAVAGVIDHAIGLAQALIGVADLFEGHAVIVLGIVGVLGSQAGGVVRHGGGRDSGESRCASDDCAKACDCLVSHLFLLSSRDVENVIDGGI